MSLIGSYCKQIDFSFAYGVVGWGYPGFSPIAINNNYAFLAKFLLYNPMILLVDVV